MIAALFFTCSITAVSHLKLVHNFNGYVTEMFCFCILIETKKIMEII
jgi:hypothetical protein